MHSESAHVAMVLVDRDSWSIETDPTFHNLLEEFRELSRTKYPECPPKIFLLSKSLSSTECHELKSAASVDGIILKPLRLSILVACFQEALGIGKKKLSLSNKRKLPTLENLLKGKRILVVDDNKVNRRVAEGTLKKYGAFVLCVESGKAAIPMLEPPHNFDACFMDLQMPEMDG